ncbi:hypothetical protein BP6252_07114 [Coleophoma cylindrospora]|uniref:Uncharacterized protein n=1 Tax=Coleophoma cylindrospora TaxID=1849047 RepID=A0A3D8RGP1_9HELO|nr:hypothetical protein BP6252_07114 [Coleophoma cylindrospora]
MATQFTELIRHVMISLRSSKGIKMTKKLLTGADISHGLGGTHAPLPRLRFSKDWTRDKPENNLSLDQQANHTAPKLTTFFDLPAPISDLNTYLQSLAAPTAAAPIQPSQRHHVPREIDLTQDNTINIIIGALGAVLTILSIVVAILIAKAMGPERRQALTSERLTSEPATELESGSEENNDEAIELDEFRNGS